MSWPWKNKERQKLEKKYEKIVAKLEILLEYLFNEVRENLKKHDVLSDIEDKRTHWNKARERLIELKKLGFAEEVRAFVKKEQRTIHLIRE